MSLEEMLRAAMCKIEQEEKKNQETISMGEYIQNSPGKSPIEWIVIDKREESKLVISKYGIDAKIYNDSSENIKWKASSLRKWLNKDFIDAAFSENEKDLILETKNSENPDETEDKIFLLSDSEVMKYFKAFNSEKTLPTKYAQKQGAPEGNMGYTTWWLKEPGTISSDIFGSSTGKMYGANGPIVNEIYAVRPAMWIKSI